MVVPSYMIFESYLACKLFFTIETSYRGLFVDFFDMVHIYNSFYKKNYSYKIQEI